MRNLIEGRAHAVLDYVTVAAFATAPTVLKIAPTPSKICYGFAAALAVAYIFTRYPGGIFRKVSLSYHAMVEFYSGIGLFASGVLLFRGTERILLAAMGAFVFAGFLLTDYSEQAGRVGAMQP